MSTRQPATSAELPDQPKAESPGAESPPPPPQARPREVGGPKGPDPTRYGDWEIGGRCIDF
jgi:hypothetical protein